jgi:hypothetical protein
MDRAAQMFRDARRNGTLPISIGNACEPKFHFALDRQPGLADHDLYGKLFPDHA